jgi:hypothetical protein
VPGYRRVNRYMGTGLRRAGHHFFWKKLVVPVSVYPPSVYPYLCTHHPCARTHRLLPVYYLDFTKTTKKPEYPCPWYPCTRDGHGYETCRVQFWKKNPSTCSHPIRLPAMPMPVLPAACRGCVRPVNAVPVSKCLFQGHALIFFHIQLWEWLNSNSRSSKYFFMSNS